MRSLLFVVAALAVIALLEAGFQLWRWSDERRRDELRRRLRSLGERTEPASSLLRAGRYAASPGLDALLRSIPLTGRMERLLEQADSRFTVAQVISWSAIAALAGVVLGAALAAGAGMIALLAALGAAAPGVALVAARERRSRKLSEQLPDALDMMGRSLRAGHALTSAFELVASEMPEPVAVEFGRAFEAQRLGLAVDQAILQMTERAPGNRDLKIFAVSALIQRETGGNLAEVLSNIAETIRARYRFYGKLRALTAEGRASAALVGAMPFVMAVVLHLLQPNYLAPLFTVELGRIILTTGAVAWLVGVAWLYRMVQLDV